MRFERAAGGLSRVASFTIAGGMLALPVLFPPEIHPWSVILCCLPAVAALGLLAVAPPARRGGFALALLILAPLAVAAVLLAPARARALDEAAAFSLLLIAGVMGARLAREARAAALVSAGLVILGTLAAVQGVLQHHIVYPQQLELLRAAAGPGADGLMVRLAAGRPAGPFILPAVLGTFLAMALPSAIVLLLQARRTAVRVALCVVIALQGYALLLTRSFGAILAAFVALLLLLPLLSRPARRLGATAIVVALVAGSGYFMHVRSAEIGHAPGSDPISLRLGNWQAAAGMIVDHPLFGVGPGAFGTSYTLYMRPGMNETRYAHNTPLQIVACWGVWALLPLGALLIGGVKAVRRMVAVSDQRLPLAAAAAAFVLHNLIDFGAYLPGIAIPGALLIGMILGAFPEEAASQSTLRGAIGVRIAAVSLAALCLLSVIVPQARSRACLEAARDASLAGDLARAAELAHLSAGIRPAWPDPWAFLAEMTLVHWRGDPVRWEAGEAASRRAVQLDPESAIRHYTRALYHLAAGAAAPAYREQAIAHRLFPLKELYFLPEAPGAGEAP